MYLKTKYLQGKVLQLKKISFYLRGEFFVVKFVVKKKIELTAYLFLVYIKKAKNM